MKYFVGIHKPAVTPGKILRFSFKLTVPFVEMICDFESEFKNIRRHHPSPSPSSSTCWYLSDFLSELTDYHIKYKKGRNVTSVSHTIYHRKHSFLYISLCYGNWKVILNTVSQPSLPFAIEFYVLRHLPNFHLDFKKISCKKNNIFMYAWASSLL